MMRVLHLARHTPCKAGRRPQRLVLSHSGYSVQSKAAGADAHRHGLYDFRDALLVECGQGVDEHIAQSREVGCAQADAVAGQVAAAGHARMQLAQQPPLLPL